MTQTDAHETAMDLAVELAKARAEIADLKRKVEQHRQVIDHVGLGIVVGSADGTTIEYANAAFARMRGYGPNELSGSPIASLFPPESQLDIATNIRLAHERGHHVWESEHVRKDESTLPVLIDVTAIKDESGRALRWVVGVKDITQRRRTEAMLRDSEARLREVLENSAAASYKRNLLTNEYEYLSPAFARICGYSEDMSKLTLEQTQALMPADDRAATERAIAEALTAATGTAHHVQYRFKHEDGEYRWLDDHFSVLRDAGGRNLALVGSVTDITDHKRAEEAVKESEANFSVAFKTSPNAITVVRLRDAKFLAVNDAFTAMTGYTSEEALATTSVELGVMIDSEGRSRFLAALVEGRPVLNQEMLFRRKNGEVFVGNFSSRLIEIGGETCVLSTTNDMSERKQAEEALRDLTDRLHLAMAAAKAGVWDWHLPSNQMVWDDRMLELYGLTQETVVGVAAWEQGLHPEDRERATEACQGALRGEREFDTEFRVRRPDGTVVHIKANGLVLRDQEGKAVRMIGLNTDITDRKRAEEERGRLEAQLHHAQKMESVGRLAGGVAHDFNNMLGVILANTEMALEEVPAGSPLREELNAVFKAAQRSSDLTRQLLAFARKQITSPRVLDLNENVGGMLKLLGRLIGEDVHMLWLPGEGLWPLKVDPSQIDQTLTNLCVNARDAIVGVGELTIETSNETLGEDYCATHKGAIPGDYVRLSVRDTGSGMDEETRARLFEPFFTTKGVGKGTGLGLATVYGMVEQNNGFIEVNSKLGVGTTFMIYLPRHQASVGEAPAYLRAMPAPLGRETILLVEDEAAILPVIKRMLDKMGYRVLHASSPREALQVAEAHAGEIHLLVTDVVMPEMNGRELVKTLLSRYPAIRVVFMSGYTADVIASHGVLDEGVKFIEKPFSRADLAAKVREALDSEAH